MREPEKEKKGALLGIMMITDRQLENKGGYRKDAFCKEEKILTAPIPDYCKILVNYVFKLDRTRTLLSSGGVCFLFLPPGSP